MTTTGATRIRERRYIATISNVSETDWCAGPRAVVFEIIKHRHGHEIGHFHTHT